VAVSAVFLIPLGLMFANHVFLWDQWPACASVRRMQANAAELKAGDKDHHQRRASTATINRYPDGRIPVI